MLCTCTAQDKENVVSWVSHGKAFKVHNVPVFVSEILPLFFNQTKYKSFQRQLNLWGFHRIQNGPEKGAYHHKQFLRDKPNLCCHLSRQRSKKDIPVVTPKATKSTFVPKKLPKIGLLPAVSPIASRYSRIPRKISEGSIEGLEELHGRLDSSSDDSLDLVNFEGVTFHPLEPDRYEELNLEFDFSTPEKHVRSNEKSALLEELEQGLFGMPKLDFDAYGMNARRKLGYHLSN
jgi:hypothetical protein